MGFTNEIRLCYAAVVNKLRLQVATGSTPPYCWLLIGGTTRMFLLTNVYLRKEKEKTCGEPSINDTDTQRSCTTCLFDSCH